MSSSPAITDRDAALGFLFRRVDYERAGRMPYRSGRLKLDRMRELLRRLDDPQDGLSIVHVAGTKGKGSTAAMLAAALSAAGYRTGAYTSPHLERLEERFVVGGSPCSEAELVGLAERVRPAVEALDREAAARGPFDAGPTFFEITTAMAWLLFAKRRVDAAVVEVGLGGRLDSTNVCQPLVTVITSISRDHTQQLGETLASIAREKAGIVKRGVPVVTGVSQPEALEPIRQAAARNNAPLIRLGRDFDFRYRPPAPANRLASAPPGPAGELDYWAPAPGRRLERVELGMAGRHQAANAAVALATLDQLERLGLPVSEAAARRGLREGCCPARIELLRERPLVILDAAHNPASIAALLETLDERFRARRRACLFGASRDKDAAAMLELLLARFDHVAASPFLGNPRSMTASQLQRAGEEAARRLDAAGRPAGRFRVHPEPAAAWQALRKAASPDDLLCVTGSFFLAAEVRPLARRWRAATGSLHG